MNSKDLTWPQRAATILAMNDIGKVIESLEELAEVKELKWYLGGPGAEIAKEESLALRQMIKVLEGSHQEAGGEEETEQENNMNTDFTPT